MLSFLNMIAEYAYARINVFSQMLFQYTINIKQGPLGQIFGKFLMSFLAKSLMDCLEDTILELCQKY